MAVLFYFYGMQEKIGLASYIITAQNATEGFFSYMGTCILHIIPQN
jgi:hypothetical protein